MGSDIIKKTEGGLQYEYFVANREETSKNTCCWLTQGTSIVNPTQAYLYPNITALSVVTDYSFGILAPFVLLCNSSETEFQLYRLGEFAKSWEIKFTKNEVEMGMFCAATILNGPSVVFVFQEPVDPSSADLIFSDANTVIILWRPILENNAVITKVSLFANLVYGVIVDDHQDYIENITSNPATSEILSSKLIVHCPLNESSVKFINFNSEVEMAFDETKNFKGIPGTYARNATCILPVSSTYTEGPRTILVGTLQQQIICLKSSPVGDFSDGISKGDWATPVWCIDIPGKPIWLEEIYPHEDCVGCNTVLTVQLEDGAHVLINIENGSILEGFSNEYICAHGDFLNSGYDQVLTLPILSLDNTTTWQIHDLNSRKAQITPGTFPELLGTAESNGPYLNSVLESLKLRVVDEQARIKKMKDIIKQKYNTLIQCEEFLQSLSDSFTIDYRQFLIPSHQKNIRRNHLLQQKSHIKLLPLLPPIQGRNCESSGNGKTAPLNENNESDQAEKQYVAIFSARACFGGTKLGDQILLESVIKNVSSTDVYDVHLTPYLKGLNPSITAISRSRSTCVEIIPSSAGKIILTAIVDLPMDTVVDCSDFGAFVCFSITKPPLNFDVGNDPLMMVNECNAEWRMVCIDNFRSANTVDHDHKLLFPSMVDINLFAVSQTSGTTTLSNKHTSLSIIPYLLEQFLGAWEFPEYSITVPIDSNERPPRTLSYQGNDESYVIVLYPILESPDAPNSTNITAQQRIQIYGKNDRTVLGIVRTLGRNLPNDILFNSFESFSVWRSFNSDLQIQNPFLTQ
ncbi:hypothetical protein G9A89_019829 [Geosiphon pyriformis]|nr:hypothetical protein G9A89_019829 [Geosiphon pyriformis]